MLADPCRIIAHRGASAYAPENSMAAFRKAVQLGAPEIETDVGFTKDRALLLLHDNTLDRTTSGSGRPEHYDLEDLKQLDAGSWLTPHEVPDFDWQESYAGEPLITLDELFSEFGDTLTYHVEIKDRTPGLVSDIIKAVRYHGLVSQVIIAIINDEEPLIEAKKLESGIRTSLAPSAAMKQFGAKEAVKRVAAAGHDIVTLSSWNHSRELVQVAHDLGIEARSSGIKNHEHMMEALDCGCNGMTINWPDWLIDEVARRKAGMQ
jgi:glycerophosphoryl diester phosphodiesterase